MVLLNPKFVNKEEEGEGATIEAPPVEEVQADEIHQEV